MSKIIKHGCLQSPSDIYNSADLSTPSKCPWVKVGNLYLSVTPTGNTSWPPIVEDMKGIVTPKFTILTGRHGDQFGQKVDLKTGVFSGEVAELKHFSEDKVEAKKLSDKGVDIEVIDVGNPAKNYNTVVKLKELTEIKLNDRIVIYAWCFSIYSMKEYPKNGPLDPYYKLPEKVLLSKMTLAWKTSVASLITEGFSWAKR